MTTKPKRNVKCCTAKQAAAIDFEPWQEDGGGMMTTKPQNERSRHYRRKVRGFG
jgi:hypothetical protein